jgi:hypothetical protein
MTRTMGIAMSDRCVHPYPEDYGASEVSWHDREIGRLLAACGVCGLSVEWWVNG